MTLAPGSKLGPYEILSSIGSGGMGEVWKARDTRLGRIVAIKKVKEQHSERFKQEARSIAALNHPNICQIFDIGDNYLILEYVEGKPLSSPLPEQEAVRLAIQIATALEAAHKKGIIHRDLKPSNIMVTDEGTVKLLDFGLAKLYEQDQSTSNLPTEEFPATQVGAILGTVAYMSPEQAQGQSADVRSDIFSFGLVLYEMLSGRRAFSGDSNFTLMEAIIRKEPPPLQTSPQLEKIVKRCLEKEPSDRYQRMSELKVDLVKAAAKKAEVRSEEPQPSIAVLPFADMSPGKDNEWFSDGLAEEIINALTKIPRLLVIARTSAFAFKDKNEDIRKIAEVLGVANILEGSVRKAGNRIRVTAQLIEASKGGHLWSERYDRDLTDVFAIQDEIAAAIVDVLELRLLVTSSARRTHEPNLAAHEAYLKARHLWGDLRPETLADAKRYLEQAIAMDPQYALAHCGLADLLISVVAAGLMSAHEAMPTIREEARKALELDPFLPEAHGIRGIVAAVYDYDWKEAERCFRQAMSHDPVPPQVRQWYGYFYLLLMDRTEESIYQLELGIKGDPLNVPGRICLPATLIVAGRLADAHAEALKILELDEAKAYTSAFLAFSYGLQEKWAEALVYAEKASTVIPWAIGSLAAVLKHMGEDKRAETMLQDLMHAHSYVAPLGLAHYYCMCGEIDKSIEWWEKVIEQRNPNAGQFAACFVRSSSLWHSLAKLMHLPEKSD
jgi:serine/threonine protein kinase/Tfp pilus assembly protein PilF